MYVALGTVLSNSQIRTTSDETHSLTFNAVMLFKLSLVAVSLKGTHKSCIRCFLPIDCKILGLFLDVTRDRMRDDGLKLCPGRFMLDVRTNLFS